MDSLNLCGWSKWEIYPNKTESQEQRLHPMEKDMVPTDFTSLQDEFARFRAELRIEVITIKERLRRINEQLVDNSSLVRRPRRLMYVKKRTAYSTADITQLAVHLGISELSIIMRIERLGEDLSTMNGQTVLPEDEISQRKRLDLAEAEILAILTYEAFP